MIKGFEYTVIMFFSCNNHIGQFFVVVFAILNATTKL